jgi:hypothetical protein
VVHLITNGKWRVELSSGHRMVHAIRKTYDWKEMRIIYQDEKKFLELLENSHIWSSNPKIPSISTHRRERCYWGLTSNSIQWKEPPSCWRSNGFRGAEKPLKWLQLWNTAEGPSLHQTNNFAVKATSLEATKRREMVKLLNVYVPCTSLSRSWVREQSHRLTGSYTTLNFCLLCN